MILISPANFLFLILLLSCIKSVNRFSFWANIVVLDWLKYQYAMQSYRDTCTLLGTIVQSHQSVSITYEMNTIDALLFDQNLHIHYIGERKKNVQIKGLISNT